MPHTLSREAMVRQLVALGVDRAKAEARVDAVIMRADPSTRPAPIAVHHADAASPRPPAVAPAPTVVVAPNGVLALTLPWHALAPDNLRVSPIGAEGKAKRARYDAAKAAAIAAMGEQLDDAVCTARGLPWSGPIALHGRAFVPDDRIRDVTNLGKVVLDALEAAEVVRNDRWCWDTRWIRVAVDPAAPRLELMLAPYHAPALPELACG